MRKQKKIDLHTHILFGVDDGAQTLEESLNMIIYAKEQGVDTFVCTPHLFSRANKATRKKQIEHFNLLVEASKDLEVTLFLGAEVKHKSHVKVDYNTYTFGENRALLLEFSTSNPEPIDEICYNLIAKGYQVIVAHVERYQNYLKFEDYVAIKKTGAYLQVNTTSIVGYEAKIHKKLMKKLLKFQLIDIIATDAHNDQERKPDLESSYLKLEKKLDPEYLNKLYYQNAYDILYK